MPEWTLDSLRLYFERIAVESDRRYDERFQAQEKAATSALAAAAAGDRMPERKVSPHA